MEAAIHIQNARVWWHEGERPAFVERDFYANQTISSQPLSGAVSIDLRGYTIFPGLINAHDHLDLNHYPRTKFRDRYDNAHQWGEDVNAHLNQSPFRELRAYPLKDRLFIGGLKNLLCGTTTVVHHNKPFKELFRQEYPVTVFKNYEWAHSFRFSSVDEIQVSYFDAIPKKLWFIHLAEGTDAIAAHEYGQLQWLDCVSRNTVLIHGVGFTQEDIENAAKRIGGLVMCPTTNFYLLGKTADVWAWLAAGGHVALGSDSRLTAEGDLLDEMRSMVGVMDKQPAPPIPFHYNGAGKETPEDKSDDSQPESQIEKNAAETVLGMVTTEAAWILNLPLGGRLSAGAAGDFIALRTGEDDVRTLCNAKRSDLALVVRGGVPQIGDPEMMARFPHVKTVPATLDGVPKAIHMRLASRLSQCTLSEPGLTIEGKAARSRLAALFRRGIR